MIPIILTTPAEAEQRHAELEKLNAEATRQAVEDVKQRALDSNTMERGRVVGELFDALVNRDFNKHEAALLKKVSTALQSYTKATSNG